MYEMLITIHVIYCIRAFCLYIKGITTIRKMHGMENIKIFGGPVCTVTMHTRCSQYYSVSPNPISHTTSTCQVQVK